MKTKQKVVEVLKNKKVQNLIKEIVISIATLAALIVSLSSCNVTRTICTESQSLQRGDTSIIIQTKTIESYNAFKN